MLDAKGEATLIRDLACEDSVVVITDDREAANMWKQYKVKAVSNTRYVRAGARSIAVQELGKLIVWWKRSMAQRNRENAERIVDRQEEEGAIVLNRYAASWRSSTMRERLKLWGLPVAEWATWADELPPNSGQHYVRSICFWVNSCRIVAAAQSSTPPQGLPMYRALDDWSKPPYRRLARLALRAAYAVGWDIAAVTLRCTPSSAVEGMTDLPAGVLDEPQLGDVIVHIDPIPQRIPSWVRERYAEAWHEETIQHSRIRNKGTQLKLGMDVELILYDAHAEKIVPAVRYLPKGGAAGCDAVRLQGRVIYPLMELRPEPAERPAQLVENLFRAMQLADRIIAEKRASHLQDSKLVWLGGSHPAGKFSLGGHIHVSGILLTSDLIRALDTYVALPLALLEDPAGSLRRRPGYGTYGDVREHDHGGEGGFEYRTLPCFIMTPVLALEVLTLFRTVAVVYPKLTRRDSVREEVIQAFHAYPTRRDNYLTDAGRQPMRMLALELMDDLLREVRRSRNEWLDDSLLVQAEHAIQALSHRISAQWIWDEHEDLRSTWLGTSER
ncbi:putative amidoligase domain-containing protein [Paenibacillus popilliae]|uniref:PhiEco32-like amidoligase-type 2 protein n=1 Tax=Paenibacillus popilliae TaxID=78057 RepID=A0ABY3AVE2_PAEPP|nr:hypothetical protein [Paenibacillus sp. SDF0028]TQR46772.1 hypothetical protein C7Y44_03710 [Paenibacillus sp. SDF0028]